MNKIVDKTEAKEVKKKGLSFINEIVKNIDMDRIEITMERTGIVEIPGARNVKEYGDLGGRLITISIANDKTLKELIQETT